MSKCNGCGECGKCQELKCCVEGALCAEKNILSSIISLVGSIFEFVITYEMILFNKSNCCISNLKILDSLFGTASISNANLSINTVTVTASSKCGSCNIVPQTDDTKLKQGILLDDSKSSISRCSACSIIVTLRGEFQGLESSTSTKTELQNTALITGNIKKNRCDCIPILPVYVKSGIINFRNNTV
ncbi:MAG: hypothetical protein Dasosvirus4_27 [Dasosvirus sp.]|uniref:Uncharacterized protein n=1 Tax=Dasosvirus sp. TaxID=2487764 RepID=A0A3G4ZRG9_9VIRU|nr:MAG: hypothetical protein Dasosvirus4_27 [Dasosvirus sp.]